MKNRVRELRRAQGITQAELARIIGVAQNTLSYWEQGKYDIDTDSLQRIADFFECSVDYLLYRSDEPISTIVFDHKFSSDLFAGTDKLIPPTVTKRDLQVALFGGDEEVTDEMWEEVKSFAEFVKSKNKGK